MNRQSANETFSVSFLVGAPSTIANLNIRLLINIEGKSAVTYTDHRGNIHVVNIPPSYVNINTQICPEQVGLEGNGDTVPPIQKLLIIGI